MSNSTTEQSADVIVRPGAKLLSKSEVLDKVGCTYPTLWKMMSAGTFPRPVVIGGTSGGKNGWLEHEVDAWIAALPRRRLKGQTDGVPYSRKRKAGAVT
jgi:prophage regulatory protein